MWDSMALNALALCSGLYSKALAIQPISRYISLLHIIFLGANFQGIKFAWYLDIESFCV